MRDQGRQPVVVAEPDLVCRHGVVLVDDRHNTEFQQSAERPVRVAVVTSPGDVIHGEQNLSDAESVMAEEARVMAHQQPLANRCRSLLGRQILRPRSQGKRRQTGRDRSGGHEDQLAARQARAGEDVDQRTDSIEVDAAAAVVSDDDPTLTTTRFAAAIASRIDVLTA